MVSVHDAFIRDGFKELSWIPQSDTCIPRCQHSLWGSDITHNGAVRCALINSHLCNMESIWIKYHHHHSFSFFFFMREKTELQRSETELFRCTKEHFLKLIQPELFFPKYCKALSRLCPLPGHPKGLGEAQAVGYYGNKRSFNQHCCPSPPDSLIPFICSLQTTHNVQAYCITKYIYYNYTSDSIWANEGEKKRKLDLLRFLNLDSGVKQFHS